jgi:hypothetical protein
MVIEDHASKVGEMNVKTKKCPFLERNKVILLCF